MSLKENDTYNENKEENRGICYSEYATRPILYTDTINGTQVSRDDMWAVTTAELNKTREVRKQAIEQLISFVFCACQPDKGDEFSLVDKWVSIFKECNGELEEFKKKEGLDK
uniref:Uncharacterized protein n=1 Tax=viral metagenome TaxID=1070528 RepID=A0A6M3LRX1_9ZZZZ